MGLVSRARDGDRRAFGRLVRVFMGPLCASVYPLVHDWHAAQDIAQDAFAAIYEQLGRLKEPEKFRAWLFRIARNRAITTYRQHRRRETTSVGQMDYVPMRRPVRGCADPKNPRPTAAALAAVRRAVLALPNDYGTLLVMRYVEGMSTDEIAEAVGRTRKAIRSALYRARILAREFLVKAGLDLERILDEM